MSVKIQLKGLKDTQSLVKKTYTNFANEKLIENSVKALNALKLATPYKTGRCRASWTLSDNENYIIDAKYESPQLFTHLPKDTNDFLKLYISNGTPYIESLNAGTSLQAPSRFVENTMKFYFRL